MKLALCCLVVLTWATSLLAQDHYQFLKEAHRKGAKLRVYEHGKNWAWYGFGNKLPEEIDQKSVVAMEFPFGCEISLSSLELFPNLEFIHTAHELRPAELKVLCGLKNLQHLELGELTDASLQGMVTAPGWKSVDLSGSHISDKGLRQLRKAENLEELIIEGDSIAGSALSELQALPLRSFRAWQYEFSDEGFQALSKFPLERLTLDDVVVSPQGLSYLKHCKSLIQLRVRDVEAGPHGEAFSDEVWSEALSNKEKLRSLYISSSHVGDKTLSTICKYIQLTELRIYQGEFTDQTLRGLMDHPNLETLVLSSDHITPKSWPVFRTLPKLKHLELSLPEDEDREFLAKELPNIDVRFDPTSPKYPHW